MCCVLCVVAVALTPNSRPSPYLPPLHPHPHTHSGQLRAADPTYAAQCLVHWRQFLRGPPNKPHRDPFGLLECVINYLSLCASAGPGHFGMGGGHGHGPGGGGAGFGDGDGDDGDDDW